MYDFYNRFIHKYPYTDIHELNLDWLINAVKDLAKEMSEFEALNTISLGGVWDISKQYSRWTVVTDSNGDGYISLQPVPAGIQIDNTDYWMKLYDFVTALGVLEARVTSLENTVSAQATTIGNLQTSVTNLTNALNTANGKITALDTKVGGLIKRDWSTRSVLFIGDSYLDGWNGSESVKDFSGYMNDCLQFGQYYKQAQGGAGFSSGTGAHFISLAQTFAGNHSAAVNNGITDIFILAGYNDLGATEADIMDNVSYGIHATLNYLKQAFPNASITIGVIARALYTNAMTQARLVKTVNAYKKAAMYYGCHYLEHCELILHDYTLFNNGVDRIHPTSEGYRQLGRMLALLVNNYDFTYIFETSAFGSINMDYTGSQFSSNPFSCYQGITRNAVTIDCYGGQCHLDNPIPSWELYGRNRILVGNFHNAATPNYFMPMYDVMIPVPMSIKHSGGRVNVTGAFILGSDGNMYLCAQKVNDDSWSYPTLTNVTDIHFGVASYAIPIEYC